MIRKTVTGIVVAVVMVVVVGTSAFAAVDLAASSTGSVTLAGTPTMSFKTSPNVYVDYHSAGPGTTATSYVAGSMHSTGDRAYGVDPDYTGMYIQTVTSAQATSGTIPNFPATSAAGSSGDFGTTGWVAK